MRIPSTDAGPRQRLSRRDRQGFASEAFGVMDRCDQSEDNTAGDEDHALGVEVADAPTGIFGHLVEGDVSRNRPDLSHAARDELESPGCRNRR